MGSVNAVVCVNDSTEVGGIYYSQAGDYYPVYSSLVTGCDSTVHVQIANLPVYDTQVAYDLCQGDSIWAEGAYQNTSGVYVDVLSTEYFCDSVVTRTLNFLPELTSPMTHSLCSGDSILVGGSYQFTTGLYYDTLSAQFGCDSILVHDVQFNALPVVTLGAYSTDSICYDGVSVSLPNGLPTGGVYSGNGVAGGMFDPALTGLIGESVLTYIYTDSNGCASSDMTSIIVYDCYLGLDELSNSVVIYPNPSNGIFNVKLSTTINEHYRVLNKLGQVVYQGEINGTELLLDLQTLANGYYYLEIGTEQFKLLLQQ
jgi:hypothetical protein